MNSSLVAPSPTPLGSEKILRHHEYYIQGGDIVFRVDHVLFRVHRYFFTRESAYFRERLPQPQAPGDFTKGTSDNHPYVLEDASNEDFTRFLWIFYNPKYSVYKADVETWLSILKLSAMWQFPEIKALALANVEEMHIAPIRKIIFYHTYDIDRDLLVPSYLALVVREEPISLEEGLDLGIETALLIARAREVARAPHNGAKKGARPPSAPVAVPQPELDTLFKDLFRTLRPRAALPAGGAVQQQQFEPAAGRDSPARPAPATFRTGELPTPNGTSALNSPVATTNGGGGSTNIFSSANGFGSANGNPGSNGNGAGNGGILGSANGSVFGTPKNGTAAGRGASK